MSPQRDRPSSASLERARGEASRERARAERYKLRQRDIRRGASAEHGRVRPSEFEARAFSIPRFASGFVRRVGRLINGNDSVRRTLAPHLDAPAAARRALEGFRGQLGEDVIARSALVVTELVTNSVVHAGLTAAQPIELSIRAVPGCLQIEVQDDGARGFEPVATLPDPGQDSGRGFWMVDQLTDRWGVDFTHSTRVWCEFDLAPH